MNPVVKWVLVAYLGCMLASGLVFVVVLNSNAEIEAALEETYDADVSFDRENRKRVLLLDGERCNCRVQGHLFGLDDVAIRCFIPDEPPALR